MSRYDPTISDLKVFRPHWYAILQAVARGVEFGFVAMHGQRVLYRGTQLIWKEDCNA